MNSYQIEQMEALCLVRQNLGRLAENAPPKKEIQRYLDFRERSTQFHRTHFEDTCTAKCYFSNLSACCSRDGIIVFFADVVINALFSSGTELDLLEHAIAHPAAPGKCIFLSQKGCLWQIKPIVCEMFICHTAKNAAFDNNPEAAGKWNKFEKERKTFTWPDQPVLFEQLERLFLDLGAETPLMHIHKSPGLLRIKKKREAMSR